MTRVVILTVAAVAVLAGCQSAPGGGRAGEQAVPHVVTADIEEAIEGHIAERTREGNGYFALQHEGRELQLRLVRVHTEYLASLGPRRHFACVDLVSTQGDVYDVDFFLAGDPGSMTVTETTVHKLNGQPFYLWEQRTDGTWVRAETQGATGELLGIVRGTDQFEFLYQVKLPPLRDEARIWFPLPQSDSCQTIRMDDIDVPGAHRILTDREYGNTVLHAELSPGDSGRTIGYRCVVSRREKAVYAGAHDDLRRYLEPEQLVPDDEVFRRTAGEVLAGKEGDLVRARALYDHTIDTMRYAKFGGEYGHGDAVFACDARHGNCTDFHSYFIALCRAAGIPARFAIGAAIPSSRDDGKIDGYHCWAEFHAEGRWWPVDISEADKYSSLATYYFGHHPANRVELSRGRDLVVEPGPASGPINFLAYPVLEVAGEPETIRPSFSFRRIRN